MDREKKIKAAITAVMGYLQAENEAVEAVASAAERDASPRPNNWGAAGRQSIMQVRNMMQLKAFGR